MRSREVRCWVASAPPEACRLRHEADDDRLRRRNYTVFTAHDWSFVRSFCVDLGWLAACPTMTARGNYIVRTHHHFCAMSAAGARLDSRVLPPGSDRGSREGAFTCRRPRGRPRSAGRERSPICRSVHTICVISEFTRTPNGSESTYDFNSSDDQLVFVFDDCNVDVARLLERPEQCRGS